MTLNGLLTMKHFIGVVEGVAVGLPDGAASLIYDKIEVVDAILDKEIDQVLKECGRGEG